MTPAEAKLLAETLKTIAYNIDRRMKNRSMSKRALAEASGVAERTIVSFLNPVTSRKGTSRSFPSGTLTTLFKLALALGVEPWELLCGTGDAARERFHAIIEAAYAERSKAKSGTPPGA